ncbi:RHS repeat-associated core domain-containing protein, partial [Pseudomonas koreensis]|uniref:RHS repeat-associated core domain-containing protein n=1 Tax=Pseudomonas koreensis TaxID=198620 RepID=UPI0038168314
QYDAYGKVAAITLAGEDYLDQPLRFQGQYFDAESGLHYNRHRYYDPRLGRYLTPDPIKLAGGLNQYRYVPNPTGWVDPLGLSSNCPPPNKPGCEVPGGASEAKVDKGEPALPKMSAQERRARIDELAERIAHKELKQMELANTKAHFLQKHGAQTTLAAQLERVQHAKNPTTGKVEMRINRKTKSKEPSIPRAATRFVSHRDQLNAINRAQLIFRRTGSLALSSLPVEMGRKVGEGYKSKRLEYVETTKTVVILDVNGNPITAYTDY